MSKTLENKLCDTNSYLSTVVSFYMFNVVYYMCHAYGVDFYVLSLIIYFNRRSAKKAIVMHDVPQ